MSERFRPGSEFLCVHDLVGAAMTGPLSSFSENPI